MSFNYYRVVVDVNSNKGDIVRIPALEGEPVPLLEDAGLNPRQAELIAKELEKAELKGWNSALKHVNNFVEKNEYV